MSETQRVPCETELLLAEKRIRELERELADLQARYNAQLGISQALGAELAESAPTEERRSDLIRNAAADWARGALTSESAMIVIHSLLFPAKPSPEQIADASSMNEKRPG